MNSEIITNDMGFSYPPQNKADEAYLEKCWDACKGNFPTIKETIAYILVVFYLPGSFAEMKQALIGDGKI